MSHATTNIEAKKVLVISSTYPRHENDFAVPWMREMHKQMQERGYEVTVMAPAYRGLATHTLDGIAIRRFRYAPANWERLTHEEGASYKVRRPIMQLLAIPYIICGCLFAAWLAFRNKYDVIHVHWPFPHGMMGQVARFVCGGSLVIMSHGAEFSLARRKKWIIPALRQSLRAADFLLANSSDTARMVSECSGRSCSVLPYGSTVERKQASQTENVRPRVLFTGRMIERKGLEYLLQAAPRILSVVDADIVLTGDGDQRPLLEELRTSLTLEERVHFLGFVTKEELASEYERCDVWVNPAIIDSWGDAEGLGVGAIEAYSYGKPVVACNVGGIPDAVVDGVTGHLVPQRNPEALADAIIDLLADEDRREQFGKAGFAFVEKTFAWQRIVSELESAYKLAASSQANSNSTEFDAELDSIAS